MIGWKVRVFITETLFITPNFINELDFTENIE